MKKINNIKYYRKIKNIFALFFIFNLCICNSFCFNIMSDGEKLIQEYDLLIISVDKFASDLSSLVNHKNLLGIPTILITIEDITSYEFDNIKGRDLQEKIKLFIKYAIEEWYIQYVLLIGDINLIPMRYVVYDNDDVTPTDFYYQDIYDENGYFSSWDTNQNNIFGEYNYSVGMIDYVDLNPDVKIGRFFCKNRIEVNTIVNKIISYELYSEKEPWFNNIILIGGDTEPNFGNINEGEFITEKIKHHMEFFNFQPIKIWTSVGTLIKSELIKEFTNGAGFICYSGHGYPWGLSTFQENSYERFTFNILDLWRVTNEMKLPIIFLSSGNTAWPDDTIFGIRYPSFAWSLVKKHNGGVIASIGSTRKAIGLITNEGKIFGHHLFMLYFFEAYDNGIKLSEMYDIAQKKLIEGNNQENTFILINIESFILIGDPSLKIGGYN